MRHNSGDASENSLEISHWILSIRFAFVILALLSPGGGDGVSWDDDELNRR